MAPRFAVAVLVLSVALAAPAHTAEPGCGPPALRTTLTRRVDRASRLIDRAREALVAGRARAASRALDRAAGLVRTSQARIERLWHRARIGDDCRARLQALLTDLAEEIAATGLPGPTTTTIRTPAPPASTTTTGPTILPTTSTTTSTAPALCGNGRLDFGEQCDSGNVFGRTCERLGFTGGELRCRPDCIFDVSRCTT